MLAHTMTPIREEEQVDGVISADVGTLNEDAHVNINVASNATASAGEEEANTSGSSSTIVPVHEEEQVDDGNIDIAYFFQVPGVKWNPKLEMMSKAGLTQGQYERKVLAEEFELPEEVDEFISIDCPDMPWAVSRTFVVQRSALERSPALAEFFGSLDYLPGCKMSLHFMNDPGACFDVVKTYLESGPERYPMQRLKIYITRLTKGADRFMVLIRLHKFAIKLKLIYLENLAFEAIHELEWEMDAAFCPKIAQLVFAHQSSYDDIIKIWILKHIGHFYKKLSRSNTWAALVPILDPELGHHWFTMNICQVQVLSMIAEEATDEAVSDALADFSTPAKTTAVSAIEGPSTFTSLTKSEASTQTDDSSVTEVPKKPEPSSSSEPQVAKTNNVTPKVKKHKRSKAINNNQFIFGMHKESVVTCTPTKRSKMSPNSANFAFPITSKPEPAKANAQTSQQPTITVSQYDDDTFFKVECDMATVVESDQHHNQDLRKKEEQGDDEWEDEEEEAAIQEAIRSLGPAPRDDSKARQVLGLSERSSSDDNAPRPFDENAKARRVLGINDDGGGLIAGRKETTMMKVKKSLTRFNDLMNP